MSHHVFNERLLHLADKDFGLICGQQFLAIYSDDFDSFLRLILFANFRIFSLLYPRSSMDGI